MFNYLDVILGAPAFRRRARGSRVVITHTLDSPRHLCRGGNDRSWVSDFGVNTSSLEGFTLIEIVISMGIMAVVFLSGATLLYSIQNFKLSDNLGILRIALQDARARAASQILGKPHGVIILKNGNSPGVQVFAGENFESNAGLEPFYPLECKADFGETNQIVFALGSGDLFSGKEQEVKLNCSGKTAAIRINPLGVVE